MNTKHIYIFMVLFFLFPVANVKAYYLDGIQFYGQENITSGNVIYSVETSLRYTDITAMKGKTFTNFNEHYPFFWRFTVMPEVNDSNSVPINLQWDFNGLFIKETATYPPNTIIPEEVHSAITNVGFYYNQTKNYGNSLHHVALTLISKNDGSNGSGSYHLIVDIGEEYYIYGDGLLTFPGWLNPPTNGHIYSDLFAGTSSLRIAEVHEPSSIFLFCISLYGLLMIKKSRYI